MKGLNPDAFLADFWQRRPLLLRDAVPGFTDPLTPEELAGLALEDGIESRLISCREAGWQLRHGPFRETDFQLPGPWTLLVQAVDHRVPAVAALHRLVNFLPGWRIDDVMVSFATDGGGVGPHYDNYDVFLLQGRGEREWHIGDACGKDVRLQPHPKLRLLADMPIRESHVLRRGDVLYVPPRLAHWGVARGDCLTYSIGFRAPERNAMLSRWLDQALEQLDPEVFYEDPVSNRGRPGEITPEAVAAARHLLEQTVWAISDQEPTWFGELVTEPRDCPEPISDELPARPRGISVPPGARLAWTGAGEGGTVFANGHALPSDSDGLRLAETLCAGDALTGDRLAELVSAGNNRALLQQLLELGCLDVDA